MPDAVPNDMAFVDIKEPGGPDVLVPGRTAVPEIGPGEVLIEVAAAGVNRPDTLQRAGGYPAPPWASKIPGLEVAGVVAAVGPECQRYAVGDAVCALLAGGGYAEYCTAPEPQTLPVPSGFNMIEAGGVPETFFTVWTNVFERGGLQPGEWFLVHGGSSGIGTTAIQLAKAFGAYVMTTVGNDEKKAFCQSLGADRVINYREEDFVEVARTETLKKGVDLILDMVGGDYVPRNIKALAVEGRVVQIAWLNGAEIKANFATLMLKRLTWTGSTLRPRTVEQKGAIAAALEEKVWPLLTEGKVKPIIHTTFPLAEAAKAHALMESSQHIGKIMLTVR